MSTYAERILAALACICLGAAAYAAPADDAPPPLLFKTLQDRGNGEVQVYGGVEPAAGDWRSILVADMPSESGLRFCTATLVGPKTILTAAHCVDAEKAKLRDVVVDIQDKPQTFACSVTKGYLEGKPNPPFPRGFASPDFALCILKPGQGTPPALMSLLRRETIDLALLSSGAKILLTGYGCTDMELDFPIQHIGKGVKGGAFTIGDAEIFTVGSRVMQSRISEPKKPSLCAGDSGGPVMTGVSVDQPTGTRSVRAVNSYVRFVGYELMSGMALLSSQEFRTFLACWRGRGADFHVNVINEGIPSPCVP